MTTLVYPGPWIDIGINATRLAVAQWAIDRIGVYEIPPGSNRSGLIDAWNTAAGGAPMGSSWCASFAYSAWSENGATPVGNAACDDWHAKGAALGRFLSTVDIGDVALFDFGTQQGFADHCGIVIRTDPTILTVEGNTNDSGSREGVGVFMHDRHSAKLLGYVSLGV
jgi:hypothetical protein